MMVPGGGRLQRLSLEDRTELTRDDVPQWRLGGPTPTRVPCPRGLVHQHGAASPAASSDDERERCPWSRDRLGRGVSPGGPRPPGDGVFDVARAEHTPGAIDALVERVAGEQGDPPKCGLYWRLATGCSPSASSTPAT